MAMMDDGDEDEGDDDDDREATAEEVPTFPIVISLFVTSALRLRRPILIISYIP